ncbi:uncharacterized protein JCM15063_004106 [Sporobolomyces koalae]|uniref:uncharacterized protein n=1 Tax=Sporobolomyces koalae TaxID=500713 RepID=UPI00317E3587
MLSVAATLAALPLLAASHMTPWMPSMYGVGPNFAYSAGNPVDPIGPGWTTFDDWWFRGPSYRALKPQSNVASELPAGGSITMEIACHVAWTSYGWSTTEPGSPLDACPGENAGPYHSGDPTSIDIEENLVSGCALAIADVENIEDVTMDNLVVFSVNHDCVKQKMTTFDVPAKMPKCTGSNCICSWHWLANNGTANYYQTGFNCTVTGSSIDATPIAPPSDPVFCKDDPSTCTTGAKRPIYAYNYPSNVPWIGNNDRAGYHGHWSFPNDGAQNDIFLAAGQVVNTTAPANATTNPWFGTPTGAGGAPDLGLSVSTATASSSSFGQGPYHAVDGWANGYREDGSGSYDQEWASNGEKAGAWLNLVWNSPITFNQLVLFDRPNLDDQITAANITFGDGSFVSVGTLFNDGTATYFNLSSTVTTSSLRLTITGVSSSTGNAGLSEIEIYSVPASGFTSTTPVQGVPQIISSAAVSSTVSSSVSSTAAVSSSIPVSSALASANATATLNSSAVASSSVPVTSSTAQSSIISSSVASSSAPSSVPVTSSAASSSVANSTVSATVASSSAASSAPIPSTVVSSVASTAASSTASSVSSTASASSIASSSSSAAVNSSTVPPLQAIATPVSSSSSSVVSSSVVSSSVVSSSVVSSSVVSSSVVSSSAIKSSAVSSSAISSSTQRSSAVSSSAVPTSSVISSSAASSSSIKASSTSSSVAPAPTYVDIARQAIATASSQTLWTGQLARGAIDGIIGGYLLGGSYYTTQEWASSGEKAGAWLQLNWVFTQNFNQIVLWDRPNLADQVLAGNITFADGSGVTFGALPNDAKTGLTINLANTVSTRSLRIYISQASSTTKNIGLSEVQVYAADASKFAPGSQVAPTKPVVAVVAKSTVASSSIAAPTSSASSSSAPSSKVSSSSAPLVWSLVQTGVVVNPKASATVSSSTPAAAAPTTSAAAPSSKTSSIATTTSSRLVWTRVTDTAHAILARPAWKRMFEVDGLVSSSSNETRHVRDFRLASQ